MSVITAANISKSFGAFDVFSDISFSMAHGDKIALVGPNGCGKTTLLRILAGLDEPTTGILHCARGIRLGYLAQTAEESNENTVWQEMSSVFAEVNALAAHLRRLEQDMADPAKADQSMQKYGQVQHEFEALGGYESDTWIRRVLSGLGFEAEDHDRPISQLSGGQRVRAALAKLLLESPEVLLLDEPTNHLDTRGVEWLESYLQDWSGTLIVVSHDRYFLDEVCDRVWELNVRRSPEGSLSLSQLEMYRGGYTDYAAQRAERRERRLKDYEAQQELIQKEMEYVRRNIAGQNTLQAKGRLKRLNRMERLGKPIERRAMSLRLNSGSRSGNIVLETNNLVIGYRDDQESGDVQNLRSADVVDHLSGTAAPTHPVPLPHGAAALRPLFRCPNLQLLRTERAALIGPNGTGKTTFLKTIFGEIEPLAGHVRIGANVHIGYFAQAHEGLNLENTVLQELMSAREDIGLLEARTILGRFLFSGDDAFKKVGMLSGGEHGRVALAKLTLQGANFLLLDEPTNHLDIPSQEILTEALNNFDGTLLLVSHDRYLVTALATQIWALERDEKEPRNPEAISMSSATLADAGFSADYCRVARMTIFRGTYDAWIESRLEAARTREKQQKDEAQKSREQERAQASSVNAIRKAERERQARLEQAEQRITDIEQKLSALSQQIQRIGADYQKVRALSLEYQQAEAELAAAWSELERL